jgi:hypothetical protein
MTVDIKKHLVSRFSLFDFLSQSSQEEEISITAQSESIFTGKSFPYPYLLFNPFPRP